MVFKRVIFKSIRDWRKTNLFTYWADNVFKKDWTLPERQYNFRYFLIDNGLWVNSFDTEPDGSIVFYIFDKKVFAITKIKYGIYF